MLIHTPNLRLLTCERAHLEAIVRNPQSLGELLRVSIPAGWPAYPKAYPHALELLNRQPLLPWSGWWLYLFTHPDEQALVGCGGFKSAPDAGGNVEIGFEIAPSYRNRGFGAEAVSGLIGYAFTRPGVEAIEALSLPHGDLRARAFKAVGMSAVGERNDRDAGTVTQWRLTREDYEKMRSRTVKMQSSRKRATG